MDDYKLSIAIPTRNRQKYCIETIKQILSLKLNGVQIVVQDNSDNDFLKQKLLDENILTENISYNYTNDVLAFVDNFGKAIELCKGEYVCMIGDDDGILPNILNVTRFAVDNNYDAIIPGLNSVYIWPSDNPIVRNAEYGYLCLSFIRNKSYEVDINNELIKLLRNGGQNYQNFAIPRLYHGLVKKSILEKIKLKTGKYFAGLTPDIYMSVALSLVCSNVCKLEYPITISGICPKSGSSDSATGKHTGQLKDAPHFIGHDKYSWNEICPAIYTVETIWAETLLHALVIFNRYDLINTFNVAKLDAICLKKYPQFKKELKKHAKGFCISDMKLLYIGNLYEVKRIFRKVVVKIFRYPKSVRKYYNVSNIKDSAGITLKALEDITQRKS